jgi:Tfp pilus assembly protein FimV
LKKKYFPLICVFKACLLALMLLLGMQKAFAIGIDGQVDVLSSIHQPLNITFPILVENEPWDESDIKIALASEREYEDVGLPYPRTMGKVSYFIEPLKNGHMQVNVFSSKPVRELAVSLLLYVQWPRGGIRYDLLLLIDLPKSFLKSSSKIIKFSDNVTPLERLKKMPKKD